MIICWTFLVRENVVTLGQMVLKVLKDKRDPKETKVHLETPVQMELQEKLEKEETKETRETLDQQLVIIS